MERRAEDRRYGKDLKPVVEFPRPFRQEKVAHEDGCLVTEIREGGPQFYDVRLFECEGVIDKRRHPWPEEGSSSQVRRRPNGVDEDDVQ